ncbi:hypothetical protein T439DRAFT_327366 [Meredithblackwellia eburnea MCA 4105]
MMQTRPSSPCPSLLSTETLPLIQDSYITLDSGYFGNESTKLLRGPLQVPSVQKTTTQKALAVVFGAVVLGSAWAAKLYYWDGVL